MANKISIQNNRIIFDGHAETLRECQLITAVCDSLSASENFRTIKYESGYAEFEKVNESKGIMAFGPAKYGFDLSIYSNDGSRYLGGSSSSDGFPIETAKPSPCTLDISATGVIITSSMYPNAKSEYLYTGEKQFLGLATAENSAEVTYGYGIHEIPAEYDGGFYYIVESEITEEETTPTLTYDLSQLNLPDGTYSITVVAKVDGYSNSAPSNAVTYKQGATSLISFTIYKTSYQAEEGMTWAEWCKSEYNTDGWYVSGNTVWVSSPLSGYIAGVRPTDEIEANRSYRVTASGGSG